jgi:23S rRNA pseudouridine2605 synthase
MVEASVRAQGRRRRPSPGPRPGGPARLGYTALVKERIHKLLANAGVASRRAVEQMVRDGRVSVNGKVQRTLPILVDPAKDAVVVDDEPVKFKVDKVGRPGGRVYFLLNKPKGVYSTNVAQGAQVRAIDLLPPNLRSRVYPVGRLDAESRGLLLLTNDGELTNQLTHPRYGIAKTYRATVEGRVDAEGLEQLQGGIWLADDQGRGFKTGRTKLRVVRRSMDSSILEVTLREGRNRQVRRMLAKVGHKVRDLMRVQMGPLTLEGLKPGQCRPLTAREVKALRKLAEPDAAGVDVPGDEDGEN